MLVIQAVGRAVFRWVCQRVFGVDVASEVGGQ